MTTWRYLADDGVAAARGLAGDEALMLRYSRSGEPQDDAALRLYTYRSHCALVGRYQSIGDELDLAACRRLGVAVGRRPTGGGAIIMGAGQLGVAVTTRAPADVAPRELLRRYAGGVAAGLRRLGIEASFRSRNDLETGGRKIAGLGLYLDDRGALLFHASVLADLDMGLMLEVLRVPGAKLSDKAIRRVSERVTTVSRELGETMGGADVREAVAAGFGEALGVRLVRSGLSASERARRDELVRTRYGSRTWIEQRSPVRDARGSALLKTPEGLVRVYVGVHGGALSSVLVAGDFNVLPPAVPRLESGLRWCSARPERIGEVVRESGAGDELGVAPGAVADAVWEAVARALERDGAAHPARAEGACYFPEDAPRPEGARA